MQVSVDVLLQKADAMFPEGVVACRPFTKTGTAARKTNELLENASRAIEALWKQRGYSPKKPDDMEAQRERGPTPLHPGSPLLGSKLFGIFDASN